MTTILNHYCSTKLTGVVYYQQALGAIYSLSNVIMAGEKVLSFHQYLRYSHKRGTNVFSILSAIT